MFAEGNDLLLVRGSEYDHNPILYCGLLLCEERLQAHISSIRNALRNAVSHKVTSSSSNTDIQIGHLKTVAIRKRLNDHAETTALYATYVLISSILYRSRSNVYMNTYIYMNVYIYPILFSCGL